VSVAEFAQRDERLPLSTWQRRWVTGAGAGCRDFNLYVGFAWSESPDPEAIDAGLRALIRRHGALRTTMRASDGRVEQCIGSPGELEIEEIELPAGSADGGREVRDAAIARVVDRSIPVIDGPLVRATMLANADEHVLLLTLHHAIADGASLLILMLEFRALYAARLAGGEPPEWPPAGELAAHLAAERSLATDAARAYWRAHLRPRSQRPLILDEAAWRGPRDVHWAPTRTVPATDVRALAQVAARSQTSFSTALAAVAAASFIHSDGNDVRVGVVDVNRHSATAAATVGLLMDVMPLAVDLAGDPTFVELLARVRGVWLDALAHRMSLWDVADAASLGTDGLPVCDIELNLLSLPGGAVPSPADTQPPSVLVPLRRRRTRWAPEAVTATVVCVMEGLPDGGLSMTLGGPDASGMPEALERLGAEFLGSAARCAHDPSRSLRARPVPLAPRTIGPIAPRR
jgi:condensation domain-containing protein